MTPDPSNWTLALEGALIRKKMGTMNQLTRVQRSTGPSISGPRACPRAGTDPTHPSR